MTTGYSKQPTFSVRELHEILDYDPDTGQFLRCLTSGGKLKGSTAGYTRKDGYTYIRVKGKQYLGHLLAWYYYYMEWPKEQLDHINGIKYDNRIINLRDVTQSLNQQNQLRAPITNKSTGVLGVSKLSNGKFKARATLPTGRVSLGTFNTLEEAELAYKTAKLSIM